MRHPRVMLGEHVRELYWDWLRGSVNKRGQVLRNLQLYLKHVEATLKVADNECEERTCAVTCTAAVQFLVPLTFMFVVPC